MAGAFRFSEASAPRQELAVWVPVQPACTKNTASGRYASVSGGVNNSATAKYATVGGGSAVTNATASTWHAGQDGGFPTGTEY